ncbi:MAG: response regulator transcription factor [Actinomycetota bacterium]
MVEAPAYRILLVEDDPTVADVVSRYLAREGYEVMATNDGLEGLRAAESRLPDLVILDLMLPSMDGHEVFRRLRLHSRVPVIMLTAKAEEEDRIRGLEVGADDYVVKPFSPRELTLRVKSILKRTGQSAEPQPSDVLSAGDIRVDLRSREVSVAGRSVALTVVEFDLLSFLMQNEGRAFSRESLLERVWGYRVGDTSTVTVHVRRLREKVEADPVAPRHLATVWGTGYRFDA